MSEMSEEQKKAIEAQKAQCPYCMIVAGKIPAKKIYEDDKILACVEIYPATKGHVIVFPKEHYPIMPIIPPEDFTHMFSKVKDITKSVKDAVVTVGSTLYVANGGIAGQKMPHFKVDIIPRDKGDKLDNFIVPQGAVSDEDISKHLPMFKANMNGLMANYFKRTGQEIPKQVLEVMQNSQGQAQSQGQPSGQPQGDVKEFTKEEVIKTIQGNPTFLNLIQNQPEQLPGLIEKDPSLAQFFKNVDVNEIIAYFSKEKSETEVKAKANNEEISQEENIVEEKQENASTSNNNNNSGSKSELDAVSNLFLGK